MERVAPGMFRRRRRGAGAPVAPSATLRPGAGRRIALASLLALALFAIGGYGWMGVAASCHRPVVLGIAPAVGLVAFVVIAIALERVGVPLTGGIGPTVVSVVTVVGGFVLRALLERRARA